jgi:hypothetical protein
MREDFVLNNQSKMLVVLVLMATDKMIRLVAMFPDVWFMDTTAGKLFKLSMFILILYYKRLKYRRRCCHRRHHRRRRCHRRRCRRRRRRCVCVYRK